MVKVGLVVATAGVGEANTFVVIQKDLEGRILAAGTDPGHEESGVFCVGTLTLQPRHRAGICCQTEHSTG